MRSSPRCLWSPGGGCVIASYRLSHPKRTMRSAATICLTSLWILHLAPPALADEDGRRGLRRFVPTPFKKEAPRTDEVEEAVADMREFTANLPGQDPAATSTRPPADATATAHGATAVQPPAARPSPPVPAAEAKPERRRLVRIPFIGPKDDAGPQAAVAEAPQAPPSPEPPAAPGAEAAPDAELPARKRLVRIPFVGGSKADRGPEPAPQPEPALPEPAQGGAGPATAGSGAAGPEPEPEPEPIASADGAPRKRWFRLPFSGPGEEVASAPERGEPPPEFVPAPGDTDSPTASPPPTPIAQVPTGGKKRWFGRIAAIGGDAPSGAPEPEPAPQAARDLGIGQKYVVTIEGTPFYSIGPTQPLPPDEILKEGSVVTMRKAGWGWSDIELPGGEMGVVSSRNLRKATSADLGVRYAGGGSSGRRGSIWSSFRSSAPVPEPELPTEPTGLPLGAGLLPPLNPNE